MYILILIFIIAFANKEESFALAISLLLLLCSKNRRTDESCLSNLTVLLCKTSVTQFKHARKWFCAGSADCYSEIL